MLLAPAVVCNCEIYLFKQYFQVNILNLSMISGTTSVPAEGSSFRKLVTKVGDIAYIYLSVYLSHSARFLDLSMNIKNSHNEPTSRCDESLLE